MTGRYHYRDGIHDWVPPGKPGLDPQVPTIAAYLKSAGYHTGLVGKWHLGEEEACHPMRRGFDEFFGFLGGGRGYFPDPPGAADPRMNHYTRILRGYEPVRLRDYTTHDFGREAVDFIRRRKGSARPFFLCLSFNAVHTPMEAPEDCFARFPNIADKKRRTYAGMLSAMDDNIGRVLQTLRDAGMERETLVCFLSDNGGPTTRNAPNASINTPLRGGKGQTWEGGIRVPMFVRWTGRLKPGTYEKPVIQMDLTATALALAGMMPDTRWPLDGVNLLPFLDGSPGEPHTMLCWDYENQWAIRKGPWKLVFAGPAKGREEPVIALYDITKDISESNDLSARHSDVVKRLQSDWQAWSRRVVINKPQFLLRPTGHH
jgi:arylsulfatase A-like enzyme